MKDLQKLYHQMLRIRLTEEEIAKRYSEQQMRCPTHLSIGQEAVAAAAGMALRVEDQAVSTHRGHAHYLGKGGNLEAMIAEIYGKETGCSGGYGGSMHLIDEAVGFMGTTAIVGNSIPIGVGLSLSMKIKKEKRVSCVYLGDGAIEEGVFFESANFACVKNLPVIFICENNMYSVYSHIDLRQPKNRKIHKLAEAIGLKTDFGDGNNVAEVFEKTKNAVEGIREGSGPCFLEFSTYRWREHCGPNYDNDIGYRTEEEFNNWKQKDPIEFAKNKLLKEADSNLNFLDSINKEVQLEIAQAFEKALSARYPDPNNLSKMIYKSSKALEA